MFHQDGRKWEIGSNGKVTSFSKPGMQVRFGQDGRPSYVKDTGRGLYLSRSADGRRKVLNVQPGGVSVVSYGANLGYVERPLRPGFVQRTVFAGGRPETYVYRTVQYRGIVYKRYVPAVYFQPKYYTWAATPWAAPAAYAWGWQAEPWFLFDAAYFVPEAAYPSAAFWLTDYAIASSLRDAYSQREAAGTLAEQPPSAPVMQLSPTVKREIADEIQRQLSADASRPPAPDGADAALPPALDPASKVFIVSLDLEVKAGGASCALTAGDVIMRTQDQTGPGNMVPVTVRSSKPGDCPVDTATTLNAVALQEMANTFQQKLGSGLAVLAQKQGAGGIPEGPPASPSPSRDGQAPSNASADAALINQAQLAANQVEVEAGIAASAGE